MTFLFASGCFFIAFMGPYLIITAAVAVRDRFYARRRARALNEIKYRQTFWRNYEEARRGFE